MNDTTKLLKQKTIQDIARSQHTDTPPVAVNIPTRPLELKAEMTAPPNVSVWELITSALWRSLERAAMPNTTTSTTQMKGTFSMLDILKNLLIGRSPITSWIGLVGFFVMSLGGYIQTATVWNELTLTGFVSFLIARFAASVKDLPQ